MIIFGLVFIGVMALTIAIPFLRHRQRLFTTWNFFLLGSANFVGLSAIVAVVDPKEYLDYDESDYARFVLGATVFYATLFFSYYAVRLPRRMADRRFNKWPSAKPGFLFFVMVPLCACIAGMRFVLPTMPFVSHVLWNLSEGLAVASLVFCLYAWNKNRWNLFYLTVFVPLLIFVVLICISGGTGRRAFLSIMLAVLSTTYWLRWKSHALSKNVIRMVLGFLVIAMILSGYSTYRHMRKFTAGGVFERGVQNLALLPQAIMNASFLKNTGDEGGTVEVSLVAIHLYTKERPPEPFFTIKLLLINPIPRAWWPDKPEALGFSLPRSIGRWKFGRVNWGPGIVGHGYHEGGLVMLVFYGLLFGFSLRFFDEILLRQQDNPYVLAMLGAVSGQVVALSRGDIVVFSMLIIGPILGILMLAFAVRCSLGIGLTYLPSGVQNRSRPAGYRNP